MPRTQKITPFLWFVNNNAQEAMDYYCSIFPDSRIAQVKHYPDNGADIDPHLANMKGKVLTGIFELAGQQFMCIDGGSYGFDFNSAISMLVECKDQEEIDFFWSKLSARPEDEQCGWCTDKFGLRWQIVPANFDKLLEYPGAMARMMQMKKIDIAQMKGES